MSSWQSKIPGCFGNADKKFARHAFDEERAKALKAQLNDENVLWAHVEPEIRKFLEGCTPEHVEAEVKEAKRLLCLNTERS